MSILRKYSTPFFTMLLSLLFLTGCFASGNSSSGKSTTIDYPTVTSTSPAADTSAVATNSKVVAVFDRAMKSDTLTQNSFTLKGAGETAIVGGVTYNANTQTATLTPNSNLTNSTVYTATITKAVKDSDNLALEKDFTWTFTTSASEDTTAPTVSSSSPAASATDVVRNTKVSVVFSEAIDPGTLTSSSFRLTNNDDDSVESGTLRYINPTTVVLAPGNNLDASQGYTLTLSTALKDLSGNSIAQVMIGFTTGTDVSSSPNVVDLGTAGNYVLLAKTGISTTGTTHITGDIAVSPESRTALTGFGETMSTDGTFATSSLVTGKLYAADMTSPTPTNLTTAVSNMEAAYTDAAGRSNPDFTELGAGEIGGLTLDPGLYKWGTGVLVTSDVTLNGSSTDVWIFQIDKDLKLESSKKVVMSGGALAKNVFWQVAGEVTLQTGATFNGVVLSQTAVVLKSGAVLNGRALAQTAVTLIANDINEPAE